MQSWERSIVFERSGVLHGLLRVRGFTQDDAHIFTREDQVEDEILKVLDFILYILRTFGFDQFDTYLSTRPEKYVGERRALGKIHCCSRACTARKRPCLQQRRGGGAFYGPKIDIKVKDSLGRAWQCSTIQVDFNLPRGSICPIAALTAGNTGRSWSTGRLWDRSNGSSVCLIEHYAGAFPLWLAPVQVSVLTISEKHAAYAEKITSEMTQKGIRVELDGDSEKIGNKIRKSTLKKVPYAVVIGDKETEQHSMSLRKRNGENVGPFTFDELISFLSEEIKLQEVKTSVTGTSEKTSG